MDSKRKLGREKAEELIRSAGERWGVSFVPRNKISEFTGGLLSPKTLANRDSKGQDGIPGAFRIGGRVCYPTQSVVDWLIKNLST